MIKKTDETLGRDRTVQRLAAPLICDQTILIVFDLGSYLLACPLRKIPHEPRYIGVHHTARVREKRRLIKSEYRVGAMRGGAACFTLRVLKSRELEFSSRVLNTIEINASHYSLQTPESYEPWYSATPVHFIVGVKGPRYLTHTLYFRDDIARAVREKFVMRSAASTMTKRFGRPLMPDD
jgi:hypothetical protein